MDKIRERTPQYWTDPKTTITQLETVGRIYAAVSSFCHGLCSARTALTMSLPCRPGSLRASSRRTSLLRRRRRKRRRPKLERQVDRTRPPACVYPLSPTYFLSRCRLHLFVLCTRSPPPSLPTHRSARTCLVYMHSPRTLVTTSLPARAAVPPISSCNLNAPLRARQLRSPFPPRTYWARQARGQHREHWSWPAQRWQYQYLLHTAPWSSDKERGWEGIVLNSSSAI